MKRIELARICHEANRALCESYGDFSQPQWGRVDHWMIDSCLAGIDFNLKNPDAPASASHECWLKEKEESGWVYGPIKDANHKTHPCIVPYDKLPREQKAKDYLFKGIVNSLAKFVED